MFGPNIGNLQVYYRRNSRDQRLFSIYGNQNNQWKQGSVDVPRCANDFQVSLSVSSCQIVVLCSFTSYSYIASHHHPRVWSSPGWRGLASFLCGYVSYKDKIFAACWVVSSVSWAGVKRYLFMEQLATFNKLFHFPLQMVFMAKHYSGGSLGDIALDDISFENCAQPLPPSSCRGSNAFRCDSGHCIDQSVKCDFEPDCCDSSEEKNSTCVNYNR